MTSEVLQGNLAKKNRLWRLRDTRSIDFSVSGDGQKGFCKRLFAELVKILISNTDYRFHCLRRHINMPPVPKGRSEDGATGRSRGGLRTKISVAVDALDQPVASS
jgi:hypothetical protein